MRSPASPRVRTRAHLCVCVCRTYHFPDAFYGQNKCVPTPSCSAKTALTRGVAFAARSARRSTTSSFTPRKSGRRALAYRLSRLTGLPWNGMSFALMCVFSSVFRTRVSLACKPAFAGVTVTASFGALRHPLVTVKTFVSRLRVLTQSRHWHDHRVGLLRHRRRSPALLGPAHVSRKCASSTTCAYSNASRVVLHRSIRYCVQETCNFDALYAYLTCGNYDFSCKSPHIPPLNSFEHLKSR